jgi:hypothetical protein
MRLLEVLSAKHHYTGNIDMEIRAEINGVERTDPYGYRPGDPYGLGPQLDAWWAENKKFPIAPADPAPESPPEPEPAEKLASFLAANPDVLALIDVKRQAE